MSDAVDLSIIVVSYNTCGVLEDCLRSLSLRREEGLTLQVIVADNSSRDGSADMVASSYPWVDLLRLPRNLGFAAANNAGLQIARGRHVLLLNSDTIVHAGALPEMVDFLDRRPEAGAVGPRLLDPDGSLQPSVRAFPSIRALLYQYTAFRLWRPWRRLHDAYKARALDYRVVQQVDVPMGAALMVRGELLRELGGLDEGYFMYFEEADLCRRIRRRGLAIFYLPAACITHKGGESSRPEKDALFQVYLESLFRYVSGDLSPASYRAFNVLFKVSFTVKMLWEIPLNVGYIWKYRRRDPRGHKQRVKRAELARNLRFFEQRLGWFYFQLGAVHWAGSSLHSRGSPTADQAASLDPEQSRERPEPGLHPGGSTPHGEAGTAGPG